MTHADTVFKPYRPRLISAFNMTASALARTGLKTKLDPDQLMQRAMARTGLSDFGADYVPEALRVLTQSLNEEAKLHPFGRLIMEQRLTDILTTRLRIQEQVKLNPQILDQEIKAPVFIAGLQRTGTTMLHRLLGADSRLRAVKSYEAMSPFFDLDSPDQNGSQRLKKAEFATRFLKYMAPQFFAIHPVNAAAPEEEVVLMEYALLSQVPEATAHVPAYARWVEQHGMEDSYRYLKLILQIMQWKQPQRRWVLKSPVHLEFMQTLFDVFPDAKIIQTHRDPLKTVASFSSMMSHGHGIFTDEVDVPRVARHWHQKNVRMVASALTVRDRRPEDFLDVFYNILMKEPLSEIQKIYAFIGLPLTAEVVGQIRQQHEQNPQNKHGKHSYCLSDFGFSESQVLDDFDYYKKRFSIAAEGPVQGRSDA